MGGKPESIKLGRFEASIINPKSRIVSVPTTQALPRYLYFP